MRIGGEEGVLWHVLEREREVCKSLLICIASEFRSLPNNRLGRRLAASLWGKRAIWRVVAQ